MPIRRVKGGYKWGGHGHVYPTRAGAERQMKAAFASGYKGEGYEKGGKVKTKKTTKKSSRKRS